MNPFLVDYNKVKYDEKGNIVNKVLRDDNYIMVNKGDDSKSFRLPINDKYNKDWYKCLTGKNDIEMLFSITGLLVLNEDKFRMRKEDMPQMSKSGYYASLMKLIDNDIIANAKEKDMYYINPYYLFKGSVEKLIQKTFVDYNRDKAWSKFQGGVVNKTTGEFVEDFESRVGDGGNIPKEWKEDNEKEK